MKVDREQLSALLDGELDELSTVRLLRILEQDSAAVADWEAFGMLGDALRAGGEIDDVGRTGALRALQQIESEPVPQSARRVRFAGRGLLPLGLAASAAAVAFFIGRGPGVAISVDRIAGEPLAGLYQSADVRAADPAEMERYIGFHRELAVPELQRTSLSGVTSATFPGEAAAGGERGQ